MGCKAKLEFYVFQRVLCRISDVPEVFYSGEQYGASAVLYDDEIGMQVVHSYEVNTFSYWSTISSNQQLSN